MEDTVRRHDNGLRYRGYIPALDVLRGIAVASVVIFHTFYGTASGRLPPGPGRVFTQLSQIFVNGVPLFFVLSGFLISGILLDAEGKPRYYKNFYIRRALRILPAYLLLLVVLKLFHFITWRFVLAALLYIANMSELVGAHNSEYGVLWSLAVEEQFYLIWPFLVKNIGKQRLLRLCLAACLLLPFSRILMSILHIGTYSNLVANADYLLYGAIIAISLRLNIIHSRNIQAIYGALGFLGLLGLTPYIYIEQCSRLDFWALAVWNAYSRAVPVMFFVSFVLYAVAKNDGKPLRGSLTRFFAFLGYLSYGLYLVHPLILTLYDGFAAGTSFAPVTTHFGLLVVRSVVIAGVSTGIAYLSRRFFEERFLRLKNVLTPYLPKQEAQAMDQTPL